MQRPFRLHLLSSAVRVQPVAVGSGASNVHSAHEWRDVLDLSLVIETGCFGATSGSLCIARESSSKPKASEDAAGAAVTNRVLKDKHRPSEAPRQTGRGRYYADLLSWDECPVVAKVVWHHELYPSVGFIVTNLRAVLSASSPFISAAGGTAEGKNAIKWTRLVPRFDLRLQLWPLGNFDAIHPGVARCRGTVVTEACGRSSARSARSSATGLHVPNGRFRVIVRRYPAASTGSDRIVRHPSADGSPRRTGPVRLECRVNPISSRLSRTWPTPTVQQAACQIRDFGTLSRVIGSNMAQRGRAPDILDGEWVADKA